MITTTQFRAVELIVQGLNMEAVAEKVGVTARTLCNWKKNQESEKPLLVMMNTQIVQQRK